MFNMVRFVEWIFCVLEMVLMGALRVLQNPVGLLIGYNEM